MRRNLAQIAAQDRKRCRPSRRKTPRVNVETQAKRRILRIAARLFCVSVLYPAVIAAFAPFASAALAAGGALAPTAYDARY
jgi:hypothetical protein